MTTAFQIARDGDPIGEPHDTYLLAIGALHRLQGQSAEWAMKYEGWSIDEVDVVDRFDRFRSVLSRTMANGHAMRHGHSLTGYYVPTDIPGVTRLVRTCGCKADPIPPSTGGTA